MGGEGGGVHCAVFRSRSFLTRSSFIASSGSDRKEVFKKLGKLSVSPILNKFFKNNPPSPHERMHLFYVYQIMLIVMSFGRTFLFLLSWNRTTGIKLAPAHKSRLRNTGCIYSYLGSLMPEKGRRTSLFCPAE